ncbi:hypothetical protein Lal_00013360 [Lupinus albus]|nr:hypothetical protein Lal_00013360 [Lupinus albus]
MEVVLVCPRGIDLPYVVLIRLHDIDLPYVVLISPRGLDLPYVVLIRLCGIDLPYVGFYLSLYRISTEEMEQRKKQGYGETIKNRDILSAGYLNVSLDGETKMALNLRESKIDVEVFHKMGFSLDHVPCRTYRHHTDRPTAPTTQPQPTIPDQPEFQALSSSSATMPSNQMIMDEFVSLRGYITTRMDALNTQNQEIQHDLHRLSSRLNNMDVD